MSVPQWTKADFLLLVRCLNQPEIKERCTGDGWLQRTFWNVALIHRGLKKTSAARKIIEPLRIKYRFGRDLSHIQNLIWIRSFMGDMIGERQRTNKALAKQEAFSATAERWLKEALEPKP